MRLTALFWWIDRWRKSSAYMDMTLEEQGAYRNLLDEAHLRGGPLPNDERILAKACGDATAWPRVQLRVMARFTLHPDGWRNETLDEVYRKTVELSNERAEAGRVGGLRSAASKHQAKDQANLKQIQANAPTGQANGQAKLNSPSPSPSPDLSPDPDPSPDDPQLENSAFRGGGAQYTAAKAAPPARPAAPSERNVKIITKMAHEVLKLHSGNGHTGADMCEAVKVLCAQRHVRYDSDTVRRALDSAEFQRKRATS